MEARGVSPGNKPADDYHDRLSEPRLRAEFSWQFAGLVQADHHRFPGPEPHPVLPGGPVHRRLGAGAGVHLHAGHGAEVLPAAARRLAGIETNAIGLAWPVIGVPGT